MQNPLEHEEAAFRIVLYAIAYFAPIVVASWIATWLGFVVFLAATATVVVLVRRSSRSGAAGVDASAPAADEPAVADTRRVVVLAGEALLEPRLHDVLESLEADDVLIVAPVPASAGEDDAAVAMERVQTAVEALLGRGVRVRGTIERGGPLEALERAVGPYGADEVVVATVDPPGGSGLDGAAADAVRTAFDGPVTHVRL